MKNGFVLACERTKEAVFIDPGDEVDELLATIASERLTPVAILLTHAHVDHVSGVARAKRVLKVPIWLHAADQPLYERAAQQGLLFGLRIEQPPPVDHYYDGDGTWGRFGDYEITVEHTPGHCPGGVCLAAYRTGPPRELEGLFVGDTLFAGSIGRTDLPGGDYETLLPRHHHARSSSIPMTRSSTPATAPKPPSAASARPTRSCSSGWRSA